MTQGIHISDAEPRPGTQNPKCVDHPNATSTGGFGLAGGGFGPYQICDECGRLFGKVAMPDDGDE